MPDLASCSEACTSSALLPIDDTMPRPVTTTRLMRKLLAVTHAGRSGAPVLLGQADPEVGGLVYGLAVGLQPAIADAEHQPAAHDALEIDAVFDLLASPASPCP